MDRLTVIFPSDNPRTGEVLPAWENEYDGCVQSGQFDVALYNEDAYLHSQPLVVVPPAPQKSVYCLLRGLPMSETAYVALAKELKHYGYKTIANVKSAWGCGYYDNDSYCLRDYRPESLKVYRPSWDKVHYWPSPHNLSALGPFIVRDAASVWTENGQPKIFAPPITQEAIDAIIDGFKESLGVNWAAQRWFESVWLESVEQYWQNENARACWRAIFFDDRQVCLGLIDSVDEAGVPRPPEDLIEKAREDSKPFTAFDFALTTSGVWRITRMFDAQFTDLPMSVDSRGYYEKLGKYVAEGPVVPEWAWCLVGKIVDRNTVGRGHRVVRGTRHFAPGTKVYCPCELGGNGWERICVIGVPRYSDKLVSMMIPATKICDFHLEKVTDKTVIEVMTNGYLGGAFCSINPAQIGFSWTDSDEDKRDIESLAKALNARSWTAGERAEASQVY
jgi:hypothetical protein